VKFQNFQYGMVLVSILVFSAAHAEYDRDSSEVSERSIEEKSMPRLNMIWNCGACTHNEKVIALIKQMYSEEVKKNGNTMSATEVAEVEIVEFRQRNPGVRVMFGVMAGKDHLKLKITYKEKEFFAGDYSANAIQGMNHLCSSVATETYRKLDIEAE
jgi:hypothetical protein